MSEMSKILNNQIPKGSKFGLYQMKCLILNEKKTISQIFVFDFWFFALDGLVGQKYVGFRPIQSKILKTQIFTASFRSCFGVFFKGAIIYSILEAPTMRAPISVRKRSLNTGANFTTARLMVPSRVLMRTDLTRPSCSG